MNFKNSDEHIAMVVSFHSILVNLALALGKLAAGLVANSAAMISDAIHSASDVFSTFIVIIGVKMSHKASDQDHPYGHERLECVAAIILSVLLTLVAVGIGYSGVNKILFVDAEEMLVPGQLALWAAAVSVLVKEAMFWYTRRAANKINSGALMADAWHHRSDALSSVGSFIGILGARMGYPILDPLTSIIICCMILHASWQIFTDAIEKMVDHSCDPATTQAISNLVERLDEVEYLDSIHTRMFGNRIYVDIEISVQDHLTLVQAHHVAEIVHVAIELNFPLVKHCMVHVNPVSQRNTKRCAYIPRELLPKDNFLPRR